MEVGRPVLVIPPKLKNFASSRVATEVMRERMITLQRFSGQTVTHY